MQSSASSSSAASGLPVLRTGPIDALRAGGTVSFKETALAMHPVETVQSRLVANEWDTSLRLTAMAHGQAAAFEKRLDRAALSQIRRLPGGPESSHALLDTYLGRDGAVGVEDFLNGEKACCVRSDTPAETYPALTPSLPLSPAPFSPHPQCPS